jgi:glycosyltransferase involved in cell wall biosynthesis
MAAFRQSRGKVVITMDGDLQDDPEEIPMFLEKLQEGYDLVTGWKYEGKGKASRAIPSKFFNRVTSTLSGIHIHDFNCPFKAYRREILPFIHIQGDLYRYIPVIAAGKGFKVAEVKSKIFPRTHGKTKYGFERFLRGFLDLITVLFLTQFKRRPLHFFGGIGFLTFAAGLVILLVLFFMAFLRTLYEHDLFSLFVVPKTWDIHPRPLLTLCMLLIIFGVQLISIGLIAELLSMRQVKEGSDDLYVVRKTLG